MIIENTLGIMGLSWQEKLSSKILAESGVKVSSADINRMNVAYTTGIGAGLSGVNLYDYIAGSSGVKNPIVSKIFALNIEQYRRQDSKGIMPGVNTVFNKLLLLAGFTAVTIIIFRFTK